MKEYLSFGARLCRSSQRQRSPDPLHISVRSLEYFRERSDRDGDAADIATECLGNLGRAHRPEALFDGEAAGPSTGPGRRCAASAASSAKYLRRAAPADLSIRIARPRRRPPVRLADLRCGPLPRRAVDSLAAGP